MSRNLFSPYIIKVSVLFKIYYIVEIYLDIEFFKIFKIIIK